jgi:Icc-related predicted phosphoesterase
MRLLALADLHGDPVLTGLVPALAERFAADAVVLAGDLLGHPAGFATVEGGQAESARRLSLALAPLRVPVFYVVGNDDFIVPEFPPAWTDLHLRRLEYGRWNFVGFCHTLPFMGGPSERTEEEIAALLATRLPPLDERTVLVTHGPARGSLDVSFGVVDGGIGTVHTGSPSLRDAIERAGVRAHIHGHVHSRFGRDGRHFNVAAGGRRTRGMAIDLVSLGHEVFDEGERPR